MDFFASVENAVSCGGFSVCLHEPACVAIEEISASIASINSSGFIFISVFGTVVGVVFGVELGMGDEIGLDILTSL